MVLIKVYSNSDGVMSRCTSVSGPAAGVDLRHLGMTLLIQARARRVVGSDDRISRAARPAP
jgi:hypothetical protein